jgi:transporter family protein
MNWLQWCLLSAFFAGLTAILAKIGIAGVDSNLAAAVRTVVVLIVTWLIAMSTTSLGALQTFSKRTWIFLIVSGLATGLSWLCYFKALQVGQVSRVVPVEKISIVFAILMAAVFLHEKLTWQHWVGGTLVLAGALVLAWK